ncbi:PP2C family protein-serine/threonine phosphatase [Dactylosporangium cerinum]|uniref:PP2C family protein-serine/threonine phosphatase n=1 Tax=Dactylosporangium cerinum TaxID=1434730 RepID=A0ABV9VV61_9ACTN
MLSHTLQESLIPPRLPHIPGLQAAARYLRGGQEAEVLGDFYDVFHAARGSWGVVVGDVSGKGPHAAKTTALARYTLRAVAARRASPSVNLTDLNAALLDWFTDDSPFLTAVYAAVRPHPRGFSVRVSCGGHEPALIRRGDGDVVELGSPGLLLGVMPDPGLRDRRALLAPGDSLIMYTHGVTEARRPAEREMFGTERLHRLLAAAPDTSAEVLTALIESTVLNFTRPAHHRRHRHPRAARPAGNAMTPVAARGEGVPGRRCPGTPVPPLFPTPPVLRAKLSSAERRRRPGRTSPDGSSLGRGRAATSAVGSDPDRRVTAPDARRSRNCRAASRAQVASPSRLTQPAVSAVASPGAGVTAAILPALERGETLAFPHVHRRPSPPPVCRTGHRVLDSHPACTSPASRNEKPACS